MILSARVNRSIRLMSDSSPPLFVVPKIWRHLKEHKHETQIRP